MVYPRNLNSVNNAVNSYRLYRYLSQAVHLGQAAIRLLFDGYTPGFMIGHLAPYHVYGNMSEAYSLIEVKFNDP